jgi:hypothetical protein
VQNLIETLIESSGVRIGSTLRVGSADSNLLPWIAFPYSLFSWWDMQQFSARAFYLIGVALGSIPVTVAKIAESDEYPVLSLDQQASELLVKSVKAKAIFVRDLCQAINMQTGIDQAERILWRLEVKITPNQILALTAELRNRITDDMRGKMFMYIPSQDAEFYEMQEPFGRDVATKFSSVYFDSREASTCYATDRPTACVFHLMRVLEIGLTALGNKFGVSLARTNWGPAIDTIQCKIRGMHQDPKWSALPDWKEQQEFYAQAASYLGTVKDAWRNYTAHARGRYSQKDAKLMLLNVRAFMEKISERMSDEGGTIEA